MENSEEKSTEQKAYERSLIVSVIFAIVVLLLDSTGALSKLWFNFNNYDISRLEHRSVFDHLYLSRTEKNVYAEFRGVLSDGVRASSGNALRCTEINFDKVEDSFDILQQPSEWKDRRELIIFNLKCSDISRGQIVVPIPIKRTNIAHSRVGVLTLNLPNEPIKYDEENVKRDSSHIAKSFLIGKLYIDHKDESIRRKLKEGGNIWERFLTAGEANLFLIYYEGGFITRSLIKIWHISIVILSSLLAIRIGLGVVMAAGAKKDARYKTGYKNNQSAGDLASSGIEMTHWATPYMSFNFTLSFFIFLYLFAVPSSWTFENFLGLLFIYGWAVMFSWGILFVAFYYPLSIFLFGG